MKEADEGQKKKEKEGKGGTPGWARRTGYRGRGGGDEERALLVIKEQRCACMRVCVPRGGDGIAKRRDGRQDRSSGVKVLVLLN